MKKNLKALSMGLLLSGALAFAGCTKGLVEGGEGDDGSTEQHVAGESSSSSNSVSTETHSGLIDSQIMNLSAKLTGVVVDDLGYPLEGVSVGAYGKSTTTNELGLWVLTDIPVSGVDIVSGTASALSGGSGNNATLATIPVSFNGGDGYSTAVTFVGTNAVVSDSAASGGTSNAPNTIVISGLVGDSGSVILKRAIGTVQGVLRDAATGRPVANATMVLVPTDNRIGAIAGTVGGAATNIGGTQANGTTVYGYREESLVTTTSATGSYAFTSIPVATSYDLVVSSTTLSALPNAADGATGVGGAVAGADSNGSSSTISGGCVAANGCLTTIAVGGGITVVPTSVSVVNSTNDFGGDNIDTKGPYVKRVLDSFLPETTTNAGIELNAGIDLFTNPLILEFSEEIRNGSNHDGTPEFDLVTNTTGEALSVIISNQATGVQYTVDSAKSTLDGNTLTLYTTAAIGENVNLFVRLKRDDFKDQNGNDLNTVTSNLSTTNQVIACAGLQPRDTSVSSTNTAICTAAPGANPLATTVSVNANYFVYPIRTYNLPTNVGPALTLAQVAPSAQISGASSFATYDGLMTYASAALPTSVSGTNTIGSRFGGASTTVYQFNPGSSTPTMATSTTANRLDGLLNRLFNAIATPAAGSFTYDVQNQAAALTVNTTSGGGYALQVFSSTGVNKTTSVHTYVGKVVGSDGFSYSFITPTTPGSSTVSRVTFTGTGTGQRIFINFAGQYATGDVVTISPQNEFGDILTSQAISLTLADNVGPVASIQNIGDGFTISNSNIDVMTKASKTHSSNITNATGEQQDSVQSTELFPTLEIGPSLYLPQNRANGTTAATLPLLVNTSTNKTYSSARADAVYTAADYASWAAAGLSRTILVNMSEAMSTGISAATVTANSATSSILKSSTTGLTSLTALNTSSTAPYMLATLADFKRIYTLNSVPTFLSTEGLADATGNLSPSDSGVLLVDKVPPLATEVVVQAGSITVKMNQPFAVGSSALSFVDSFWLTGSIGSSNNATLTADIAPASLNSTDVGTWIGRHLPSALGGKNYREAFQFRVESFNTSSITAPTATGRVYKMRQGTQASGVYPANSSDATRAYTDARRRTNGLTDESGMQVAVVKAAASLSVTTAYLSANYAITNDLTNWNGTMTVTVSGSSSNIDTTAFFSELSLSGTSSTFYDNSLAFFPNAVDESLNSWATIASTLLTHNDYYYCASNISCYMPVVTVTDRLAPRLQTLGTVSTGDMEFGTDNIYLNVAHSNGTLINTNATINGNDALWQIGDTQGTYTIALHFRENIDCSSCSASSNNTSRYTSISVGTSGTDLNVLRATFSLSGTAVENDSITISGAKDYAGNTTGVITVALDDTTGGGIQVSPTNIIY